MFPIGKVLLALWLILSPEKQVEIVHSYAQSYLEKIGCQKAEIDYTVAEDEIIFLARCQERRM
jgi:hypothetical protein